MGVDKQVRKSNLSHFERHSLDSLPKAKEIKIKPISLPACEGPQREMLPWKDFLRITSMSLIIKGFYI